MINFEYQNPARIIFGQGAVKKLSSEILKYGKQVLMVYGRGRVGCPGSCGECGYMGGAEREHFVDPL